MVIIDCWLKRTLRIKEATWKKITLFRNRGLFITTWKIDKFSVIFGSVIFVDTTSFQKSNSYVLENYKKLPFKLVSITNDLSSNRVWQVFTNVIEKKQLIEEEVKGKCCRRSDFILHKRNKFSINSIQDGLFGGCSRKGGAKRPPAPP